MIVLRAVQITRQFDAEPVLRGVSFEVRAGERIGLVGPNGAGKTTLFRIVAGLDEADEGGIELAQGARVELLEQRPQFSPEQTLLDEARSGLKELYALQQEAESTAARIATEQDPALRERWQRRYDSVQVQLHQRAAFNIDHRVDEVLTGLGFSSAQYAQPMDRLSGGQQNRVTLARALLCAPEVMLLDEPTNHLDIAATEWLEGYLLRSGQAMIIVSHDRYFLDQVTQRTFELHAGRLEEYPGNFSTYWKLKAERRVVQQRTFEKQQDFIAKTEDFIRRNHYGQKHAQAADREKKLERLDRIARPSDIPSPSMGFGRPRRTGDWVIDAQQLTKSYAEPLFRDFSLQVLRGERLGLFGPNGSGKTTLLRALLGEVPPDGGVVRFGANVEIAYYDQQLQNIEPTLTVVEAIRPPNHPQMLPAQLRDLLAKFGLRGDLVDQTVGNLSGGERSKAALARVAALQANLLVLDEPTNHLDIWARAALEQALLEFDGTLLFVSHDRYFLDRIATRLIVFEGTRLRVFDGNYSAYVDSMRRARDEEAARALRQAALVEQPAPKVAPRDDSGKARRKRKFPYRKLEDLEAEITGLEEQQSSLLEEMGSPDVLRDGQKAREIKQQYEDAQVRLTQLYEHWEEAAELNG